MSLDPQPRNAAHCQEEEHGKPKDNKEDVDTCGFHVCGGLLSPHSLAAFVLACGQTFCVSAKSK